MVAGSGERFLVSRGLPAPPGGRVLKSGAVDRLRLVSRRIPLSRLLLGWVQELRVPMLIKEQTSLNQITYRWHIARSV